MPVVIATPIPKTHGNKALRNTGNQNNNTDNQPLFDGGNNGDVNNNLNNGYNQRQNQMEQNQNKFDQQLRGQTQQTQQPAQVNPASYAGTWVATMNDGYRVYTCYVTNYANGAYMFSNSCPQSLAGEVGSVALFSNGTWYLKATNRSRVDYGTYTMETNHNHMQGLHGYSDWYRVR